MQAYAPRLLLVLVIHFIASRFFVGDCASSLGGSITASEPIQAYIYRRVTVREGGAIEH